MSDAKVMLSCKGVSIRYMVGDFKNIGLKEWVMRRLTGRYEVVDFWADKNITFSLSQGEMMGIIGTNGAGKSTLLKTVSGIMEPTEGQIVRRGAVVALLELSSGFDGDLTVKENAYLRGALLGYTRAFMDETYPYIIEFAELQDFENRPFKQLSSGMRSRLAFAIASLVKPEILILDEVLSVGDGAFRAKSEAKMREIIKGGATTILVSHSTAQVRSLCDKVLWLDHGRQITFSDDVKGVCDCYETFLAKKIAPTLLKDGAWTAEIGEPVAFCAPGRPFQYSLLVKGPETLVFAVRAFAARDRLETGDMPMPRAGLVRLRFSNKAGRPVAAPALWTSSVYGGEFVYIHLDADGKADFKFRVKVPKGATVMDVQFCPFRRKIALRLSSFEVRCGDDPAAQGPRVHDPSELEQE